MRLTATAVRRARGRGQLLDAPCPGGVAGVASTLVGVQAQDMAAAGLCIRARTAGLVAGDVAAACSGAGPGAVVWSLRGTRHLHHRHDVRWLVGLLGPVFARPGRRADQLGIGGATGDAAVAAVRRALETDGPLTRPEVADRLAGCGVDPSGQGPIHVIRRAALEGVLGIVPGADGLERYALLDDLVPITGPPVDPRPAAAELARRYLAAYAPATPADFAAWSGLPAGPARRAWADVGPALAQVDGPGGRAWMLASRAEAVAAGLAAGPLPLRLTGAFDTLWLGHADRSPIVTAEHSARVNAGGGMVKPLVLVDGRVAGTWAPRRRGRSSTVEVRPFRALRPAERHAVAAEAADVGRFLGTDPALAWVADGG